MRKMIFYWLASCLLGLLLIACQPLQPPSGQQSLPEIQSNLILTTYFDPNGFFSMRYPKEWVTNAYFYGMPFPHAALSSQQEIVDRSVAEELLPAGQIGVMLMLIPRVMFEEIGITESSPLHESLELLLLGMSDAAILDELMKDAEIEVISLANGAQAAQLITQDATQAYDITLVEVGTELFLVASQIEALGYRNPPLETQIDHIIDSFKLTASPDAFLAFVMDHLDAINAGIDNEPPTVSDIEFDAVELHPLSYTMNIPAEWHAHVCDEYSFVVAQASEDTDPWCATGTLDVHGLLVGLDVRNLDFMRSIGLGGTLPTLDDLYTFNSTFFDYQNPEAVATTLFDDTPALRVTTEYANGAAELAYMGFVEQDVFLLGFAAPSSAELEAAMPLIEEIIQSLRPSGSP